LQLHVWRRPAAAGTRLRRVPLKKY